MPPHDPRPWRKLYKTARWQRLREYHLAQQPLCAWCMQQDIVEEATVVHHKKAHKGDEVLFFDPENLLSLCKPHHDREGQMEDDGKKVVRFDAGGWPI